MGGGRTMPAREPGGSAAYYAVREAIAAGRLPRPRDVACTGCGAQAAEYHHHKGYAPEHRLDVVAVCRSCHRREGWNGRRGGARNAPWRCTCPRRSPRRSGRTGPFPAQHQPGGRAVHRGSPRPASAGAPGPARDCLISLNRTDSGAVATAIRTATRMGSGFDYAYKLYRPTPTGPARPRKRYSSPSA